MAYIELRTQNSAWGIDVHFRFGEHALDTDRRELRRASELISIGPQVFDLLAFLVQNRERVVSKDDLLEAVWHGRIVSESTLTSHINLARKAICDSGEEQLLIRTVARKGFRFVGDVRESPPQHVEPASSQTPKDAGKDAGISGPIPTLPALPDKPSIAVLPFQNLSGDPEQDYFADGMVEDIIAALSRMHWLFVIARNSTFTYKGQTIDVQQVGRELGVRYLLQGSVRKAGDRVRISSQVVDTSTRRHIWAGHFDGKLQDVFDMQDDVVASVIGAISPRLEAAEIERAKRKPTESLDAYDYYLRGMAAFYSRTRETNNTALQLFYRASELDPDFAPAFGMAAFCYILRKVYGWMVDRGKELAEGTRVGRKAVGLGKDDAGALCKGGFALGYLAGDLDSGVVFLDRALLLDPNLSTAWFLSGWLRAYRGELDAAIEHHARAMRLSPLDPLLRHMQNGTGYAHLLAGRYEEASSWSDKAFREDELYLPAATVMAASKALAGKADEAREAIDRMRQIDPTLRVSSLRDLFPIRRPEDLARFEEGLRKAGLPE